MAGVVEVAGTRAVDADQMDARHRRIDDRPRSSGARDPRRDEQRDVDREREPATAATA
jgi:hypothetical protein